jgi:hypothetical protein
MILFITPSEIGKSTEELTTGSWGGVLEEMPVALPSTGTGTWALSAICEDGDGGQ